MATKLTKNKERFIDEGLGVPTYFLEKLVMRRCGNIYDTVTMWRDTEKSFGRFKHWPFFFDNSVHCYADSEGNIVSIEWSSNNFLPVYGSSINLTKTYEDILWHANHHMWLPPKLTGAAYESEPEEKNDVTGSYLRANGSLELLEMNYGNIDLNICKKIARDIGGRIDTFSADYADICRFPTDERKSVTVYSWIVEPDKLIIHLSHSSPSHSVYIPYNLSEIFE